MSLLQTKPSLKAISIMVFIATVLTLLLPFKTWSATNDFRVLCYHDVSVKAPQDAYGVTLDQLRAQFEHLKMNYKVVSIDDVIAASKGGKALPENAVLITFDDGLSSFYDLVYPLLKEFKYPAVFAVVGKWIEDGKSPDYGYVGFNPPMTTWKQLKEMSDSGMVAVVSHTYNSHYGHIFNPQGNEQAAMGFLQFNIESKKYEAESDFFVRVKTDLQENERLIKKHLGKNYPIIVWPYGTFNGISQKAASELGLYMQFSIENGINNTKNLNFIYRGMILSTFSKEVFEEGMKAGFVYRPPVRAVSIDVDSLWTGDEEGSNIQLGKLNDKAADVRPNLAIIQAFSKSGEAYFPTTTTPVKANFFARVAHVLQNRSRIERVYARVPLKYLKDLKNTEQLIHDLAIHSDIDGVFFDANGFDGKNQQQLINIAIKTGSGLRPIWSFGYMGGKSSVNEERFKYVVKDLKNPSRKYTKAKASDLQNTKYIVSLDSLKEVDISATFKSLKSAGVQNFYLPINFGSFSDKAFLKENFHYSGNPYSLK